MTAGEMTLIRVRREIKTELEQLRSQESRTDPS